LAGHVEGADSRRFHVMWQRRRGPDPRALSRQYTTLNSAGKFALAGLRDGQTLLYIFRADDDRYALVERVRLPDEDLKVLLRRGLSVQGTVVRLP